MENIDSNNIPLIQDEFIGKESKDQQESGIPIQIDLFNSSNNPLSIIPLSIGFLQEEEDFQGFYDSTSQSQNNEIDDLTDKRGKIKEKEVKEKKKIQPYNYESKHLSKADLLKISNHLKQKNMYLIKYLNSGGEADVYLGKIKEDGKKKERVFRIIKAKVNGQIQQIKSEYEKVKSIKKPKNIIQYESLEEHEGMIVFVMKRYQGSLKDGMLTYLDTMSVIDEMKEEVLVIDFWNVVFQLFYGLVELRLNNIIHSDIKPANILKGKNGYAYSDFGMALNLQFRQDQTEENRGYTFKYCSPEHLDVKKLSYQSDLYSVGAVIFELSDRLKDEEVKQAIKSFLTKNLLQEEPQNRIKLENLFPSLLSQREFKIPSPSRIGMLTFLRELDLKGNTYIHQSIDFSFQLTRAIILYFESGKYDLVIFKSINEFSFEFLNEQELIELFCSFVKNEIAPLTDQDKLKYLQLMHIINEAHPEIKLLPSIAYVRDYINGSISYKKQNYQESIEFYSKALLILLEHQKTYYDILAEIYTKIGDCQLQLNQINEAQQSILKGFEIIEKISDKKKKMICLTRISKPLNPSLSFIFVFKVADCWKSFKYQINHSNLSEFPKHFFKILSFILFDAKEYTESYEASILHLRLGHSNLYNLVQFEQDPFMIVMNLEKFSSDQIKYYLNKTLNEKNNDLVKKLILIQFMAHFLEKDEFEEFLKIKDVVDSIQDEMQLAQQIQLKKILASYFRVIKNKEKEIIFLKEAFNLIVQPNIAFNQAILSQLEVILVHLWVQDMIESARNCLQIFEEQIEIINYDLQKKIEKRKKVEEYKTLLNQSYQQKEQV